VDLAFVGNATFFAVLLAWQFGLFSTSSNASTSENESPNYDPDAYSDEISGTEGDDDEVAETDNLAWFLYGGNDSVDASEAADYANGGAGDDTLMMREGDDIAEGGDGADRIDGGIGNDQIYADAGNDTLTGNQGNDRIYGGDGDDLVLGGSDTDILYGGAGNDTISGLSEGTASGTGATGIDGTDLMYGGDGDDEILLGQGDTGYGGAGDDGFIMDYTHSEFEGAAAIQDFAEDSDTFEVHYVPGLDDNGDPIDPVIEVTANEAGDAAAVSFDGTVVANIVGGQNLTAEDIRLVAVED